MDVFCAKTFLEFPHSYFILLWANKKLKEIQKRNEDPEVYFYFNIYSELSIFSSIFSLSPKFEAVLAEVLGLSMQPASDRSQETDRGTELSTRSHLLGHGGIVCERLFRHSCREIVVELVLQELY